MLCRCYKPAAETKVLLTLGPALPLPVEVQLPFSDGHSPNCNFVGHSRAAAAMQPSGAWHSCCSTGCCFNVVWAAELCQAPCQGPGLLPGAAGRTQRLPCPSRSPETSRPAVLLLGPASSHPLTGSPHLPGAWLPQNDLQAMLPSPAAASTPCREPGPPTCT